MKSNWIKITASQQQPIKCHSGRPEECGCWIYKVPQDLRSTGFLDPVQVVEIICPEIGKPVKSECESEQNRHAHARPQSGESDPLTFPVATGFRRLHLEMIR